jgi:hypothetical protein
MGVTLVMGVMGNSLPNETVAKPMGALDPIDVMEGNVGLWKSLAKPFGDSLYPSWAWRAMNNTINKSIIEIFIVMPFPLDQVDFAASVEDIYRPWIMDDHQILGHEGFRSNPDFQECDFVADILTQDSVPFLIVGYLNNPQFEGERINYIHGQISRRINESYR